MRECRSESARRVSGTVLCSVFLVKRHSDRLNMSHDAEGVLLTTDQFVLLTSAPVILLISEAQTR